MAIPECLRGWTENQYGALLIGAGLVMVIAAVAFVWLLGRLLKRTKKVRLGADWSNETDPMVRLQKRLAFETGAASLDDIKVWRRRKVNVVIRNNPHAGEYAIPHDVEPDLDVMSLEELGHYEQPTIIDEVPCPTYIEGLDALLDGGTYKGELTIVYGPPKSGRSLAMYIIGANVANNGGVSVFASAHMGRDAILTNLKGFLTIDDPDIIRDRVLNATFESREKVGVAVSKIDTAVRGHSPGVILADDADSLQEDEGRSSDLGRMDYVMDDLRSWSAGRGSLWVSVCVGRSSGLPIGVQTVADNVFKVSYDMDARILTFTPIKIRRVNVSDAAPVNVAIG